MKARKQRHNEAFNAARLKRAVTMAQKALREAVNSNMTEQGTLAYLRVLSSHTGILTGMLLLKGADTDTAGDLVSDAFHEGIQIFFDSLAEEEVDTPLQEPAR